MNWQDLIFAAGGLVFIVSLIPTLLDPKSEVPRWKTAVPTAVMVAVFGFTHLTIALPIAATANFLTAAAWFGIAWLRPIRQYQEIETAVQQFEVTQEEAELILAHREWRAERARHRAGLPEPGETPAAEEGCEGCPSQAPAGGD